MSGDINFADIGDGQHRRIAFDEAALAVVAERLALRSLSRLGADLDLSRTAQGVRVHGRLYAEAVAACAISAEDVPQHIDEPLDVLVLQDGGAGAEDEVELSADDLDIMLVDAPRVDLEALIVDSLALALDPFPRASDDAIAAARVFLMSEEKAARLSGETRQAAASSPFAARKDLPQRSE
ncbi:MAG: DUF177 domain-containing protein [Pseudomonadota bacterium]